MASQVAETAAPGRGVARVSREQQRHGCSEPESKPPRRRQLQPRDDTEGHHAGKAAQQVDRVAAKRRQRRHLAAHALRQRGEQRRDDHEEERQEHRALDEHHRLLRSAREVDAAGCADTDLEPEEVHGKDHDGLEQREPDEEAYPRRREQAAHPDSQKAREQDEVREVPEEPDVRRHPANQRNLEEQNEKRGEEDPRPTHVSGKHRIVDWATGAPRERHRNTSTAHGTRASAAAWSSARGSSRSGSSSPSGSRRETVSVIFLDSTSSLWSARICSPPIMYAT